MARLAHFRLRQATSVRDVCVAEPRQFGARQQLWRQLASGQIRLECDQRCDAACKEGEEAGLLRYSFRRKTLSQRFPDRFQSAVCGLAQ